MRVAFSLVICLVVLQSHAQTDNPYFNTGFIYYDQGDYADAITNFNLCIEKNSKDSLSYFYRGLSRMNAQDYKNAEKDLKRAIHLGVKQLQAYWGVGTCYYNMAKYYRPGRNFISSIHSDLRTRSYYHKAIKWLDKSIDINPHLPNSYINRGACKEALGRVRDALDDYNMTIKLDPTFALAYNNRGAGRYYNQNVEDANEKDVLLAIEDFRAAIRLDPGLAIAERNMGIAFSFIQQYDSAIGHINRSIMLNDNDPVSYLGRGRVLYHFGNYNGAIDDFMKALLREPHSADAYIEMGLAKSSLGLYDDAIRDQYEGMKLNHKYLGVGYYNIACSYALMGNKEQMFHFLRKAEKKKFFNRKTLKTFMDNPDYDGFRKDPDFLKYVQKLNRKLY